MAYYLKFLKELNSLMLFSSSLTGGFVMTVYCQVTCNEEAKFVPFFLFRSCLFTFSNHFHCYFIFILCKSPLIYISSDLNACLAYIKLLVLSRWDSKKVIHTTDRRHNFYLGVCNSIYQIL